jgi:hypoxanthine phosphoribosyltransferase
MADLWSSTEVAAGIAALADELVVAYAEADTVNVIPVMTGALHFASTLTMELERRAPGRWLIAPVFCSAYGEEQVPATVRVEFPHGFEQRVRPGHPTLVLDDVLDTGVTIERLVAKLEDHDLAPISVAVLVDKPHARTTSYQPDYAAFTTETDRWLVGYGMDHQRRFRGLDAIRYVER